MSKTQLRIDRVPNDRPRFVKALRLIGRMGLKQANDLALHLDRFRHSVLAAGIDPDVAEHMAVQLRDAGAEVRVEASSIDSPMLCVPKVNEIYRWGPFRVVDKAT